MNTRTTSFMSEIDQLRWLYSTFQGIGIAKYIFQKYGFSIRNIVNHFLQIVVNHRNIVNHICISYIKNCWKQRGCLHYISLYVYPVENIYFVTHLVSLRVRVKLNILVKVCCFVLAKPAIIITDLMLDKVGCCLCCCCIFSIQNLLLV